MRILIADDEPPARRLLNINLTWAGHEVIEAEDGEKAWETFLRESVRLVITDWMMPRLDGPGLVRRIRGAKDKGYTYIIMLTALGTKPQVVMGLEAGADDYLTKPFDPDELLARVKIGARIIELEENLTESNRKMEQLAMHDTLTGIFNRRATQERAEADLSRTDRDHQPISLILLDIDHFKQINDHYGHAAGDQALRLTAELLTSHLRDYDCVGRWGGEEFLLVLPNATQAEAAAVAERIRQTLADTALQLEDGRVLRLTASLGVAARLPEAETPRALEALVHMADMALYQAKEQGRNRVCLPPTKA